jgi:carbamoyl-phosphate synthase large subunit
MGIDRTFGLAFAKSQMAAGDRLPTGGMVFLSVADRDKQTAIGAAQRFMDLGFSIAATAGTATFLEEHGVPVATVVAKLGEATGVDAVDLIASGKVDLVINSPRGRGARADGDHIRAAAQQHSIPCLTTAAAGVASADGIADWTHHELRVRSLQEYHASATDQLELEL